MDECLVHTGQHFDAGMSDVFFEELGIPVPTHYLEIHGGGHGAMTGRMLIAIEDVLEREAPDGVLVYGDTNSTLAGALAAAKRHIPVVHVEAGLRSFNKRMPEEINRVLTDHMSSLLLCPTGQAVKNLKAENITNGVHHVGDVMYDATRYITARALKESTILEKLRLEPKSYALATIHRQENTDDPAQLAKVFAYLEAEADKRPLLLPIHPRTRQYLEKYDIVPRRIRVCDPLGAMDMHRLLHDAVTVYTDSGGLQKEAYFHRVPCVTLRSETEWVETVEHGWNRLWESEENAIPRREIGDYGDGHAAAACLEKIRGLLV